MIIGKPITIGGSGLKAQILASGDVLSTDTVTATKGSKTVNGVWDSTNEYFLLDNLDTGTWSVTATRGSKSLTYSVVIDVIGQYEVEINFTPSLYNAGDECENFTGGWKASGTTATLTKNASSMIVTRNGSANYAVTNNKISTVGFTTLSATYTTKTVSSAFASLRLSSTNDSTTDANTVASNNNSATSGTITVDLTSYQNSYYVDFGIVSTTSGSVTLTKIWLT